MDQRTYIEPSFDLKRLHQILCDPNSTEKQKIAAIMGIHVKFWHASEADLARMLYRAGHSKDVIALCPKVLESCKECHTWKKTLARPQVRATLATHFNHTVQTDLFFLWDRTYIVLICECIRYAVTAFLPDKSAPTW